MTDQDDIVELLLKQNYISADDAKNARDFAEKQHGQLLDYLKREGLVTKQLVGQAVAESKKLSYIDLKVHEPTHEQILLIPEDLAKELRVVAFAQNDKAIAIATDTLKPKGERLQKLFSPKTIKFAYAMPEDLDDIFAQYRQPLETRFSQIIAGGQKVAPEIIEEIVEDALTFKASDIHFEPQEKETLIRFRVDGVLQEAGSFEKQYYESVLNRIKVLARLRLDEHFSVQDGAIRYQSLDGDVVDLRISVAPTLEGEKIAIRLLNVEVSGFNLSDIGLSVSDQAILEMSSKKPFGMILATGPTGSGKTTSLYSVLKFIKNPQINITTIEDPVEYRVPGVSQIQVNVQTNITFAEGLRSIVRQDPDVILVGEIRDRDTAEIAVNAALTGHLLLSTFHANDAATAIPRLLDMDIEPFLLASTLELVIAQRLVRRICENCRYGKAYTPKEVAAMVPGAERFLGSKSVTLYQGKGCRTCHGLGFKGRMAVFELIPITDALKDLILKRPSRDEVWQVARKAGAHSLFEDGLDKVKKGVTTLQELVRVVPLPEKK